MKQGILLESGTNEVEFIELYLGSQSFGVNVAKVKQIVVFKEELVSHAPQAAPSIYGMFMYRDKPIPLMDLNKSLGNLRETPAAKPLVMVTEFNGFINGFLIDGVNRIHRVSWDKVQPVNAIFESYTSCFTGSINIDKKEILILDLEQIVAEINPDAALKDEIEPEAVGGELRKDIGILKIIIAEDSTFTRNILIASMKHSGFEIAGAFDNGQDACDFIENLKNEAASKKKPVSDFFNILITDIEMPRMDGLTLCKQVKEKLGPNCGINVVVFSSLINNELIEKCKKVGADGYLSKPDLKKLKETIFDIVHKKSVV